MNVEIGAEAAQFLEKEYINGIAVAVQQLKHRPSFKIWGGVLGQYAFPCSLTPLREDILFASPILSAGYVSLLKCYKWVILYLQ